MCLYSLWLFFFSSNFFVYFSYLLKYAEILKEEDCVINAAKEARSAVLESASEGEVRFRMISATNFQTFLESLLNSVFRLRML